MIYLCTKEYKLAFNCFDATKNYKFALKSLKKLNNINEIFAYTNKIAFYLGIVEYNDIYSNYINSYFNLFFIERKNLNEEFYLEKLNIKNTNLSYHEVIREFFLTYLNQINNFQNNNNKIIDKSDNSNSMENIKSLNSINYFFEEQFDGLKEELKISLNTIHFINAYYLNILENILKELLKLFPEFIIFNTSNNNAYIYTMKKLRRFMFLNLLNIRGYSNKYMEKKNNIIFKNRENYYKNLEKVIDYFIYHSNYNKDNLFIKYIFPFLINHGYFYFRLGKYFPKNSEEIKLFFDLSLNNYELISNIKEYHNLKKFIMNNTDYSLYYLCYILRIGISDFIIYKNKETLKKFLFTKYSGFKRLDNLTDKLKKHKKNQNYDYNDYNNIEYIKVEYENINKNVLKFLNFLINKKRELTKIDEIIEYLDIGASLSLFLIAIYFRGWNNQNQQQNYYYDYSSYYSFYIYDINLVTEDFSELFQNLYMLCNIISSSSFIEENLSYNKKLILFSLFSIFNISPFPYNDKLLNNKIFLLYKNINGCLLNYNSILFSKNFFNERNKFKSKYFDIFSDKNDDIFEENYFQMFNLEGNNIIVNYNTIITLFRLILSKLIQIIFQNNFIKNQPSLFHNYNTHGSFYSSILFYYNNLNFYIKNNFYSGNYESRDKSINIFLENIYNKVSNSSNSFPLNKNRYSKIFELNDYLKELMLYDKVNYKILYSFLINYSNLNDNNINFELLIFILKEKWNINFKKNKNKDISSNTNGIVFYEQFKKCLNYIKDGKTNIFISLILLRRTLPIILKLIKLYFENYDKNDNMFITDKELEKKDIFQIYSYEKEKIWNNIRQSEILSELKNTNKKIIVQIICKYILALKK